MGARTPVHVASDNPPDFLFPFFSCNKQHLLYVFCDYCSYSTACKAGWDLFFFMHTEMNSGDTPMPYEQGVVYCAFLVLEDYDVKGEQSVL